MSLKGILDEADKLENEANASGNQVLQNIVASIRSHVAAVAGDAAAVAEKVASIAKEVQENQEPASAS